MYICCTWLVNIRMYIMHAFVDYPLPKEATSARLASSKSFVALPLKDNNVYDGPRFGALKMTYEGVRSCLQHSQETNTQVVIREEDGECSYYPMRCCRGTSKCLVTFWLVHTPG